MSGMFDKVLFVCVGNICRSPTAEALLQHLKPELTVSSAGLGALVGHFIDEKAQKILDKKSIPHNHSARQLNETMLIEADVVLAMEEWQVDEIIQQYPLARGKVFLLGKWDDDKEIDDPYQRPTEVFVRMYDEIEENIQLWIEKAF